MTLRRLALPALLILALAAFLTKEWWHHTLEAVPAAPAAQKAYFHAEWGMSPAQVSVVNGVPLKEQSGGHHFYQAETGSEERYQSLEAPGHFLGRDSVISYTFHDGKLVSYHIFISDSNDQSLDADMRRYLTGEFGPGGEEMEDGASLKMVWQTKDRIVNYWLYEEPNALTRPYRAGFGVQHRTA